MDVDMTGPPSAHLLAGLLLASRAADLVSTRLATPKLALESNPLARAAGWPLGLATLLAALVPYLHRGMGVALFVASMLVAASNFTRGWVPHALGEQEVLAFYRRAAREAAPRSPGLFLSAGAAVNVVLGLLIIVFSGMPSSFGVWVGVGVAGYGFAVAVHGLAYLGHLKRESGPRS